MINLLRTNITSLLLCCIAFCMPLSKKIIPILIILLVLVSVANFAKNKFSINKKHSIYILLPLVFYCLHVGSYFFSINKNIALFDLEVKLSFIALPVCFLINNKITTAHNKWLTQAYKGGCVVSSVVCIVLATIQYSALHSTSVYFYSSLSYVHHPSYYAMYLYFAVVLFSIELVSTTVNYKYYLKLLVLIWLCFIIVLLSSKAGILLLFCSVPFGFYYLIIKKHTPFYTLIIISTILVSLCLFVYNSNMLQGRINEGYTTINAKVATHRSSGDVSSTQMRIYIWQDALTLIKQKPMGYTTGNVDSVLVAQYIKTENSLATQKLLNAHNQYLQTTLALGIVGLLVLLALLYYPLFKLKSQTWFLYLFFSIIITLNFLTESMLQTQSGVVFFVFIYCLLCHGLLATQHYSFKNEQLTF